MPKKTAMTPTEFTLLGLAMRQAQRKYFKQRHPHYLDKAKELETQVDKQIKKDLSKQGTLFPC